MTAPHPLDEHPIHQAPLSMRYAASSDRNFYDRCIMHCFSPDGSVLLITGFGAYPNLGVMDAYATTRRARTQVSLRASEPIGADRMTQRVGPVSIEVLEPLGRLRAAADGDRHGLSYDLTFSAVSEAFEEPLHTMRVNNRLILEGSRFVQTGTWTGHIRLQGEELTVNGWPGDRDRSWGIRPVGEPEPGGRPRSDPTEGIWWCWAPLSLPSGTIMLIAQEEAGGRRTMNEAVRIPAAGSGRSEEQLGWPRFDITYRDGTRWPERAMVHLSERDGRPLTLEITPLNAVSLNIGCGYGSDPEWTHGQWKGEGWVDGSVYDLDDPEVSGRSAFSIIDHVARVRCGQEEGIGIFEHGAIGRHDPSGFTGFEAMGSGL